MEIIYFSYTISNMVINYCGEKCFKIQSGKLSIVADPLPRFKGDIALFTATGGLQKEWPTAPNEVLGPGEYEIQETEIIGMPARNGTTTYLVKTEEMRLGFLGEMPEAPEPGFLDKLGEVDILFAPAETSAKIIKQIQPKIVIPSYKKPDQLKEFIKEIGQKSEPQEKLVIKKKELTPGTKVVVLKP